jgi:cell division protein ZapA (FtsZ GTPase activity inhibitor)
VTAPEDKEVRVQCPESPKLVRVIRGQWWLAMSAGCKASTSSWEIVARDKAAVKEKTVVVSVYTNVKAWTGEAFNFTVDTPAPMKSVTSDILQALRELESKLPVTMLVAIGVAATAVVVVTSCLIITYVKFKKFRDNIHQFYYIPDKESC